ncbi:KR domain-containing protein [Psychromonas sp. MME2]|uniref:KR domain-containing protein n=1 Tax=Psychromonas sp. MME2 TaxID=3231033 RepID=UPI00339BBB6D
MLADKLIEQKTLADFDAVYRTKIDGLLSLLACCDEDKLQHLVLFSSAAGFYGNPGQSDYAIANDILNKTAYRFKALHPTAQVLSFNWGPWDGGMVTAELKRMFNDRGVYIIPLDAGAELFASEMAADSNRCVQILVGNDMGGEPANNQENSAKKPLVSRFTKSLLAANNAFLKDHQIAGNAVFPTVCAIAMMVETALQTYPDYYYLGLQNYQLFKGIVFDGNESGDYIIELTWQQETPDQLTIAAKICSDNGAGKVVFNYAAILLLAKKRLPLLTYNAQLPDLIIDKQSSATQLYRNGTLFHGPSLQGIQAVNQCDQNGLILSCQIDAMVSDLSGEFALHTSNIFANDLVYQAMLVWVRQQLGLGSLPSATLSWTVYDEVTLGQPFYLLLTITEQQGSKVVGDVCLIAADKKILAEVRGVTVTCSENLNNLFTAATVKNDVNHDR